MPPVPAAIRALAAGSAIIGGVVATATVPPDPFAPLAPTIRVTAADRAALDVGGVIARALPADDGHIGVFAAARFDAQPAALIMWTRAIESLKRGPFVHAVGRFSHPPLDSDLDEVVLDEDDLESLRRCRPGRCDVKLAAMEIEAVTAAIAGAGSDWRAAATAAFKRVLIGRVKMHRAGGLAALPPYAGRSTSASVEEAFDGIVTRSRYLATGLPAVVPALKSPSPDDAATDAFYYWSKEHYGTGKPVISVTHVRYWPPAGGSGRPAAVAASTQIFGSHYIDAALGVTMVLCERDAAPCYLAYVNRTHADVFGGLFGGFKRAVARRRIESQAPGLMRALRDRVQGGVP
jgi:hypothetical protein